MLDWLLHQVVLEQNRDELEGMTVLDNVVHEEDSQEGHGGHLLAEEEAAGDGELAAV